MIARSLRLRLLIVSAVTIFVALAAAWIAMGMLFERHVERRMVEDLTRDAKQLVAALTVDARGVPMIEGLPSDPRFALPGSGRYWSLASDRGTIRSRSLWDQSLSQSREVTSLEWRSRLAPGPFEDAVMIVERRVRTGDRAVPVLVQIAEDEAPLRRARAEFGRELMLSLLLLWVVLATAAWGQVQLGLRPLGRLRTDLAGMLRNPSRRLREDYPHEVAPLAGAINALAQTREEDLARARRRAADLAHSLKTPLAALSAQSRLARAAGAGAAADGLDQAIAAAAAALEAELARARAVATRQRLQVAGAAPAGVVDRLITVIERTEAGMARAFETDIAEDMTVPVDPDVLTELLGTLIENAARFARRRVRITGDHRPGEIRLCVEDDGPGIDAALMTKVLDRGARFDEVAAGHGLGLAIARDLTDATEGTIALCRSELGGLRVVLAWRS